MVEDCDAEGNLWPRPECLGPLACEQDRCVRHCGPAPVDSGPEPYLAITEVLAGDPEGFAVAELPRDFVFPADHGRHPEFRTEWWYFTGHLAGEQDYGFQLTFFRSGLPEAALNPAFATAGGLLTYDFRAPQEAVIPAEGGVAAFLGLIGLGRNRSGRNAAQF